MELTQAKVLSCGTDRAEEAGKAESTSEYPRIRKRVPEVCACIPRMCTIQGSGFVLAAAPTWRGEAAFVLICGSLATPWDHTQLPSPVV